MARIRLDLPKQFAFSTEIQVRIRDINYGGHLGNDSVLSLMHEARLRFLTRYGYSESNIEGFGFIMIDSVIVYKSQAFYGDTLTIEVAVDEFSKYGFDFIYRMTNKETGQEIARAKTGIVFFDYEKNKIARVPQKFKTLFATETMIR
jgi:YbgC/YbaW family acyl-CoA thioester hydrolase